MIGRPGIAFHVRNIYDPEKTRAGGLDYHWPLRGLDLRSRSGYFGGANYPAACRGEEATGDRAKASAKAGVMLPRSSAWLRHRYPAPWLGELHRVGRSYE